MERLDDERLDDDLVRASPTQVLNKQIDAHLAGKTSFQAGSRMTPELLRSLCEKEKGCYATPDLNEKLYLSHKGFKRLAPCLGAYTSVAGLFLESNGLEELEHLSELVQLKMLYVSNNCLESLAGLDGLLELEALYCAHNRLESVSGLGGLPKLVTISLSHNLFTSVGQLEGLLAAAHLRSIDLSHNHIDEAEEDVAAFFARFPVKCVYFQKNKRKFQNWRRRMISSCPQLSFLDDRPVFELERTTAEAWGGGDSRSEVETKRVAWVEKKMAEKRRSMELFNSLEPGLRDRELAAMDPELREYYPASATPQRVAGARRRRTDQDAAVEAVVGAAAYEAVDELDSLDGPVHPSHYAGAQPFLRLDAGSELSACELSTVASDAGRSEFSDGRSGVASTDWRSGLASTDGRSDAASLDGRESFVEVDAASHSSWTALPFDPPARGAVAPSSPSRAVLSDLDLMD